MTRFNLLFAIVIAFILITGCTRIIETDVINREISEMLDTYYNAMEDANIDTLMTLFDYDSVTTGMIQQDEFIIGWSKIKEHYENFFNSYIKIKAWRKDEVIHLSHYNEIVWITSTNHCEMVKNKETIAANYYQTVILRKIGGRWKFIHVHNSNLLASNQKESQLIKTEKTQISATNLIRRKSN